MKEKLLHPQVDVDKNILSFIRTHEEIMGLLWKRRSELHAEQVAAIETLEVDGRYLLLGPPGSGKTSILLHRGQYVRGAKVGHTNIRLITFARSLREFIANDGDDRFPPTLILTLKSFLDNLFEAYRAQIPDTSKVKDFTEANLIRANAALELIKKSSRKTAFELVLVDEVQDLSASEVEVVHLISPRTMFAGDARQKIYEASGAFEKLYDLNYEIIELKHHFRISPAICAIADVILPHGEYLLSDWCRYNGPSPPIPRATGGLKKSTQIEQMLSILDIQMDTYNEAGDLIGIIVSTKNECIEISNILDDHEKYRNKYGVHHGNIPNRRFDPAWKLCVLTLKSCKGLEFRAVHWMFVDEVYRLTAEAAFTAVTRAKTSLNVYHDRPLKHFMAGAFPSTGGGLFEDDD